MATERGWRRLIGCLVLVFAGVGVLSLLIYGLGRSRVTYMERQNKQLRQRLFGEVKNGRSKAWVFDAELLSMLANDPNCVANITSLSFSMIDLSDSRFRQASRFPGLTEIDFYECDNTDTVLDSIKTMPTVETVSFEVSTVTDQGIRLLSTLPNLKAVHFEQIMPADQIELIREHLSKVETVYWSRTGGQEKLIHDKPASGGEP